ncbi:MAG: tetratricopeptide repeat protein [Treponema sp.]|jgi:tetratricopeptide (TPR) repeat protein|nr:tetratricopeptide repeat protein [Treponema sp.]
MRYVLALALLIPAAGLYGENLPDWFIPLREAVYEQNLRADDILHLFRRAEEAARETLSGAALHVALSRCEYMMGRACQEDGRKEEAIARYEKGIEWAEKALAIQPTAGAYEMLAGNIGQACLLKPTAWTMANGLKVEQNAKKALELDPRNATASYFIASRWVFGPGLLGNPQKGIRDMQTILNGQSDLQKNNFFDIYSAIGYAYIRLKKYQDALPWVQKSLEIYPTNKFAGGLLSQIQQDGR